ncbi:hypothetical protein E1301_Tti018225 [Triplophysa tibetana]|uniref:Ig-like domain-containing protein n=1 Tax=Triplophysa tibetana TaxID=1572043 RepID=A0A5A9NVN6_9TELE|nr:hypothetical protein E1301_Tti018225 [Triplophysa tibetana]
MDEEDAAGPSRECANPWPHRDRLFHFSEQVNDSFRFKCLLCLPKQKFITAYKNSSSNLRKDVKVRLEKLIQHAVRIAQRRRACSLNEPAARPPQPVFQPHYDPSEPTPMQIEERALRMSHRSDRRVHRPTSTTRECQNQTAVNCIHQNETQWHIIIIISALMNAVLIIVTIVGDLQHDIMDDTRLIVEVEKRKVIYDPQDVIYKDVQVKERAWEAVEDAVGVDEITFSQPSSIELDECSSANSESEASSTRVQSPALSPVKSPVTPTVDKEEQVKSCCYIYAMLVNIWTIDKVYSRVTIDGVIGGSVLLPCASKKHEQNLQDINVLWRYNANMNVFTILKGKGSVEHQEPKYKNKTEFFPDEFLKGIFSIQLNNLVHTDAGEYDCYIVNSGEHVKVWLLINVYSQVTVNGVIGSSVFLPCTSNITEYKLQDVNVHWRYNASMHVCDILKGKGSVEHQEPRFKNKTEFFPGGFVRGNFSIQLNKLEHTDAGEYECYIVHSGEHVNVRLLINESTEAKEAGGDKSEETNIVLISITVVCVFVLVMLSIFLFVYKWVYKPSRSQESNPAPEELEPVNQNHHD